MITILKEMRIAQLCSKSERTLIGTHVLLAIAEPMSDLPQLQLSFCRDIIRGLAHLHDVLLIPLDLGARTCQVTQSLSIKVKHTYRTRATITRS